MNWTKWETVAALIDDSPADLAVVLPDWEFMTEWEPDIFGPLKAGLLAEEQIEPESDSGSGNIGLFRVPAVTRPSEIVWRMLLTQSVKLIVSRPSTTFLDDAPDLLKSELLSPGEFSEPIIQCMEKFASGFRWLVLYDGNERDAPYLLLVAND